MSATKKKAARNEVPDRSKMFLGVDALLSEKDLLLALQCSRRYFATLRSSGNFPEPDHHVGNRPRWRTSTYNRYVGSGAKPAGVE